MKTVASFREPYKAHIARGKLEAEGIPAVVLDEHLVWVNWTHSEAVGGVKVQVPEEALDRAREILNADFTGELTDAEEIRLESSPEEICPKCGSSSISSNRYSLWSLIPSLLFLLPIFFRRKKWACDNCGTTW